VSLPGRRSGLRFVTGAHPFGKTVGITLTEEVSGTDHSGTMARSFVE
jgi:hypothetical protein